MEPHVIRRLRATLSGESELAFLRDPFESFGRAFDTILTIVAICRKQPDHLISAAGGRTGNVAGSKINSLSNGVLMLQRPLHHARRSAALNVPLSFVRPSEPRVNLAHRMPKKPAGLRQGNSVHLSYLSDR